MKIYKISFRNELDILAKNVAKYVFDQIVKSSNHRQIIVVSNPDKNIDLSICNLPKIVFEITDPASGKVTISGTFLLAFKNPYPYIRVGIDTFNFSKRDYEFLLQRLKYTTRHEIEHALHYNKNHKISPSYNIPTENPGLLGGINISRQYLLDVSEMDAYIRDLMMEAKNKRVPIERLVDNLIRSKLYEINPDEVAHNVDLNTPLGQQVLTMFKEIKDKYYNRIGQLYNRNKNERK